MNAQITKYFAAQLHRITALNIAETNRDRAINGLAAFKAWVQACNQTSVTELEQDYAIGDMIADVLHLAATRGEDFDQIVRMALIHTECEVGEGDDLEQDVRRYRK